ncbi:MAG: SRPBCC family protein, partial [Streptosporangiaceae bacterium]
MSADRTGGAGQTGADQTGASRPAVIAPVRHEVVVNAPIERAFRVFTDDFGRWWPKAHTIASFPVDRAIIESWAGGRCFDRGADGRECDWGQVLVWEPPVRLVLAWQVDGAWSYEPEVANASRVTISFAALGGQTRVTLVHDEFERHLNAGPDLADGVRDGWGTALRQFAGAAEPDSG